MPFSFVDKDNRYIWTTMHPKYVVPYCCYLCSETILREALWICDYPVNGKTCDALLCNAHAYKIAEAVPMKDDQGDFIDDVHVCPAHYAEWQRLGQLPFWNNAAP